MNYIGKSHYQIFFPIKGTSIVSHNHTHKLQASHKHTMGKCITRHQLLSCTLQICYPSHSHEDLCGKSKITMDFQVCNEAWFQRKLVFLDSKTFKQESNYNVMQ